MKQVDVQRTIDAVWRMESAKLIAALARIVRDVGLAEDLAQDALVAALERWPEAGIPDKPGAWLMATAKNRALDLLRRNKRLQEKQDEIGRDLERSGQGQYSEADIIEAIDDYFGDDVLRLIFTACHPVLGRDARVALTLRMLGGLTTEEIARAFLKPVPTVAQRIVRAKRTLAEENVRFELPAPAEFPARLSSVLEVIYLIFNEGYAATSGEQWLRADLCQEALRLGRVLAGLAPQEPEVHGLVALMELQASRLRARVGPHGEPVLLADQDRSRWDRLLVRRGLAALGRGQALVADSERSMPGSAEPGPYLLQAAIAACHARARTTDETDWAMIAGLYAVLAQRWPSPVVELNRAVAVSMAFGPQLGLTIVDQLTSEPLLQNYHLLPGVRGDLLVKLGRLDEARAEFERAAALTQNARERTLMLNRAAACIRSTPRRNTTPRGESS